MREPDRFYYYIPQKDDLAAWVKLLDEARWMMTDEALYVHYKLHEIFGDAPNDALLDGEKALSDELRRMGIEHRYTDALSEAAGTKVEAPRKPTLTEVHHYLNTIQIHSGAVKLLQGVEESGNIYAAVDEAMLPPGSAKVILRQINKMMPPGVIIKPMPKTAKEEFAQQMRALDLTLERYCRAEVEVVPWKKIAAAAPESVLKSDDDGEPQLNITAMKVLKSVITQDSDNPHERFILGPVLVPDEEDSQSHIYGPEDVRKGAHWWAENSGVLSHHHVLQGGRVVGPDEMKMVETYILPVDWEYEPGQVCKAGTWLMGAKTYTEELAKEVDEGRLNSWSIGADVLAAEETVVVN